MEVVATQEQSPRKKTYNHEYYMKNREAHIQRVLRWKKNNPKKVEQYKMRKGASSKDPPVFKVIHGTVVLTFD
jgi:hypothetical protein